MSGGDLHLGACVFRLLHSSLFLSTEDFIGAVQPLLSPSLEISHLCPPPALGFSCSPFLCIPPRQQRRLAAGLRAGAAAEQRGAASSRCSSCLPTPKPAEEALAGPCDSGPSHRCLFQLGRFRHRPVPALSASNCHGNESSPFY